MRFLPLLCLLLSACTMGAHQNPLPSADYSDDSTPANLSSYNGGLIADRIVEGYDCNIVTPRVADAIAKWQGSRNGFFPVLYAGNHLWAIKKGIVFRFSLGLKPLP